MTLLERVWAAGKVAHLAGSTIECYQLVDRGVSHASADELGRWV